MKNIISLNDFDPKTINFHYENDSFLFYNRITKIFGFKILNNFYLFDYDNSYKEQIKDKLFVVKILNTRSLKNEFLIINKKQHEIGNDDCIKFSLNKICDLKFSGKINLNDKIYLYNIFDLKSECGSGINYGFRNFNLLIINTMTTSDYNRFNLIRTLNLKYYFKKILKLNIDSNFDNFFIKIKKNIENSLNFFNKNKFEIFKNGFEFYNKVLNNSAKFELTNTFLYKNNIIKFKEINNLLKNKMDIKDKIYFENKLLLDNVSESISKLLRIYYLEINLSLDSNKQKKFNPKNFNNMLGLNEVPSDRSIIENELDINKLLCKIHKKINYTSFKNNEKLIELFNITQEYNIVSHSNLNFYIFPNIDKKILEKGLNQRYLLQEDQYSLKVEIDKIYLWKSDIHSLALFMFILDKNLCYDLITNIEQSVLKIRSI